jgi:hypothetical protein
VLKNRLFEPGGREKQFLFCYSWLKSCIFS